MNAPNGLKAIKEFYNAETFNASGYVLSPENWEVNHIVTMCLSTYIRSDYSSRPIRSFRIHVAIRESLTQVMQMIEADYPNSYTKLSFSGSYVPRMKRGVNEPSMHGLGAAVDFNASEFPMTRKDVTEEDMPAWYQSVVHCFREHGWKWGGDFGDTMHFQFGNGY
jgi:hypothetical protein